MPDRADLSSRDVGLAAIAFGAVGTIIPIAALTEYRDASGDAARALDLSPILIALLGHIYLAFCGVTVLRRLKPRLFPYFLAVEAAYGISLIFLLTPLTMVGLLSPIQARWSATVSFGFIAQVMTGFPLW